jgi:LasA protease
MPRSRYIKFIFILLVLIITLSCRQSIQPLMIPTAEYHIATATALQLIVDDPIQLAITDPTQTNFLPVIRKPDDATIVTPTPDVARRLPEIRSEDEVYIVQAGDSLQIIANRFNVTVQMLLGANEIPNPDLLEVGQTLLIPAPIPGEQGTGSKIIPDSELVYGPYAQSLDVQAFLGKFDSYLNRYSEDVEGHTKSGPEIVQMVAQDYSVNPRLLIAILEYQSGWVTKAGPSPSTLEYPIGYKNEWYKGLYQQLAWAADNLNRGYYLWKVGGIGGWLLSDGEAIPIDPTINAGTAGVQKFFSLLDDRQNWNYDTSPEGFFATFSDLFGHPFDYTYEPLIPDDLVQPELQLPFEPGVEWAFTGGPHGGWGSGSAWAALDFAPGYEGMGCVYSGLWVTAAVDGLIVRADEGRVIQDLDGDGNEGTGWNLLYMHIEGDDRVKAGTYLKAGDRIGHPSCEGGYSTGTHFHFARKYNGEWIAADRQPEDGGLPFNLEGWISSGDGIEYDGFLERDGAVITAYEGFFPANTISR